MKIFDNLTLEIGGQSHSERLTVSLSGLPAGERLDTDELQSFLNRRKSGVYLFSTPRRENDRLIIDGGIENGLTCEEPFRAHIDNADIRPADYSALPRPSHADYAAFKKYGENAPRSGGGAFSGRMTAPLVAAGGVAVQLLKRRGVIVLAYVSEIAGVKGTGYCDRPISPSEIEACHKLPLPMLSGVEEAVEALERISARGDSAGGKIECVVFGAPAGLGGAMTDGLESKLAAMLFGIPAVKAVESGDGCALSETTGSRANDPLTICGGRISTETNRAGGVNGGISNGMPLTLRVSFRPTPTIGIEQRTVDLDSMRPAVIAGKGRHDVAFLPRAVVAVEAAVALTLLDETLTEERRAEKAAPPQTIKM